MLENLALFIVSSALLCLSPGPDNIYVFSYSLANGRKSGVYITLGLCIGLLGHILMAVIGVAVLLKTNDNAYLILKTAGALYLLYIAWGFFKNREQDITTTQPNQLKNRFQLIKKGVLLNISNPKIMIFFLAFLPQFIIAEAGFVNIQIIVLGFIFILLALIIFSMIAAAAQKLSTQLSAINHVIGRINIGIALIFVALAIKLLFSEIA